MSCFWLFVFYTMNKIMFFLVLCKFTKSLGTQSNLCLKIGTFITNPKTILIKPGTIPSFHPLSHQNSSPPSPTFSFVDTKKKTISLLCSPLMESEWPQTQTQNDYLILHLLLSLHPDLRIRLQSARLTTTTKASGERYVQMQADAPFKIALFADLHYGEATSTDRGPLKDVNSTRVMNTVLDDETPGNVIASLRC